ncbi:MAG TPA: hypothetical protein VFZ65_07090, partial [Planctomycetota bacterium]|nr:hypothetical protein [Planctomycetota bacterium]
MTERVKLHSLYLSGFKSFAYSPLRDKKDRAGEIGYQGKRVEFGDVTLLLGANGAGKSNVVALFRMLGFAMTNALQEFVFTNGKASSLLHYGAQVTPRMEIAVELRGSDYTDAYRCTLADAAPDTLVFTSEVVEYHRDGAPTPSRHQLGAGHDESRLPEHASGGGKGSKESRFVFNLLQRCKSFQFHDTSSTSRLRKACYFDDSKYLRHDAGNLAAFLLGLKTNHARHYDLIRRTVSSACPQFEDFELSPS